MQEQQMEYARMVQQRQDAGMVPTGIQRPKLVPTMEEQKAGPGVDEDPEAEAAQQALADEFKERAAELVEEPVSG
jgi:hypothetical protein